MKGPREDINSYYLNQLGLAGGQVPALSCFIDGQSKFNFIGFNPVAFLTFCDNRAEKYLISYRFRSKTLSTSILTLDYCSSPSSDSKNIFCSCSTFWAMISHSFSNLRHSSSYLMPHSYLPASNSSLVGSGTDDASFLSSAGASSAAFSAAFGASAEKNLTC